MAQQTLSNIGGYLKRFYSGPIRDELNNSSVLDAQWKRSEAVSGDSLTAYIPHFYKRNQGIGFRAEGGTLPTAGRRDHKYSSAALAYMYGSIQLTGQAIKGSRDNATSFAKVVENEFKGMIQGLKKEKNRAWWGDGSGALARITQATGSITAESYLTVDDASQLEPGMTIDTYAAKTGGSATLAAKTISQVDYRNSKISLTTTETVTISDYIFRDSSRGLYPMGIQGLVDGADSAATRILAAVQGITRANDIWFDASVLDNAGTLRDLSLDLMQQAYELGEMIGQGRCKLIIMPYALRRSYLDLLVADRRYVDKMKLSGGWTGLEYIGGGEPVAIVVDHMARKNQIFFLDTDDFSVENAGDVDFMDLDGAVLRKVSGADSYEATVYQYLTLAAGAPNKSTVLRDVQ